MRDVSPPLSVDQMIQRPILGKESSLEVSYPHKWTDRPILCAIIATPSFERQVPTIPTEIPRGVRLKAASAGQWYRLLCCMGGGREEHG